MLAKTSEHHLDTTKHFELVDVTDLVRKMASDSRVNNGLMTIYSHHTTCCIRINEFEENLLADFEDFFEKIAPRSAEYKHNRTAVDGKPNAHSHLLEMLMNTSETIPIRDGEPLLGRWQTVFFVELDGPRKDRRFFISIIGE
jgi:secondary thiamine-phosphate synthase enzyme